MVSPGVWSAQGAGVDHDVQIAVAVEIAECRLDLTVQRLVDAWMSIPSLLILLTVMSVVGRGVLQIILVLGVLGGIGGSRVVRGAVIGAKEQVYFEAARAVGSSRWRTLVHHLLPNIAPVLIVIYSINIGAVVISEASLSFLGFGLPTTVPSWGGMLSREGRKYMEIAPRLAVWPGLCLTVVVYCLKMVGDAVRDLLDPRLRGSGRLGTYGSARQDGAALTSTDVAHTVAAKPWPARFPSPTITCSVRCSERKRNVRRPACCKHTCHRQSAVNCGGRASSGSR